MANGDTAANVTFAEPIASIVYGHCSNCHRPGQAGPFPLLSYADVSQRAETIQAVIRDSYMPPWKPIHTGLNFSNDRRLTDHEKNQMEAWIAAGCPEGDISKLPKVPDFPDGWSLGVPDLVVQMDRPFESPVPLSKGTKLVVDIVYDNSAQNPENPFSPPRPISWGRESTDEMGSITMLVIAKNENERVLLEQELKSRTSESLRKRIGSQMGLLGGLMGRSGPLSGGLLKLLDRNRDGKLQKNEIPEKQRDRLLDLMDNNNDETLDQNELENGRKSIERFLNAKPKGN